MNPHVLYRASNLTMWLAWLLAVAIFAGTGDWYTLLVLLGAGYAATYVPS